MNSLIELEEPYLSRWNKGYLQIHPNGRKYICLYNNPSDRSLVSYARYLLNVKAGYFLPSTVEADHIDDDKTNDDEDNIQALPGTANKRKNIEALKGFIRSDHPQTCQYCCGDVYSSKKIVFCSVACKNASQRELHDLSIPTKMYRSLTTEDRQKIQQLRSENMSCYKISELTGFSRNTIMKYW